MMLATVTGALYIYVPVALKLWVQIHMTSADDS